MTSDWPLREECEEHAKKFPMGNEFPTTYLPPENKGFESVTFYLISIDIYSLEVLGRAFKY